MISSSIINVNAIIKLNVLRIVICGRHPRPAAYQTNGFHRHNII